MRQIRNCVPRYSSPCGCSVANIRKLAYDDDDTDARQRVVIPTCRLCETQATHTHTHTLSMFDNKPQYIYA